MNVVVLTKRQYTNRDVIDDRYGRLWEIPLGLARSGCRVTCICLSYRPRKEGMEEYVHADGHAVRWISVNLGVLKLSGLLKYLAVVRKVLRQERPDIIWSCSDTIYTVFGRWFAKRFNCAAVADLYDNFEYFGSYRLPGLRGLYRRAVRDADGVSCVGESLKSHIVNTYGRTKLTRAITNAVDRDVFRAMDRRACREKLGLPQDAVIVGSAGDISNYRGADMMYRMMRESDASGSMHLAVAGFRTADTIIPEQGNVHDLGMLPFEDVPVFLNALDLAIVYNRSSSFGDYCFPQKFYEVLACGIPIVAANVGELRLLLANRPQLLYEDGDVPSLVRAIQQQLEARLMPDLSIPGWQDQADLLLQMFTAVQAQQ